MGDERRLAFVLGGRERWVIDVARFAGRPVLRHEKRGGKLRVEMRGARYPGTSLPADFVCDVTPGLVGCQMRLTLALGGFRCERPFEGWLEGTEPARARVRLSHRSPVGPGVSVGLAGAGEAEFSPTWALTLRGPALATVAGLGESGRATADAVTLDLPTADQPSVLVDPPARRARLTLDRGTHAWRLRPSSRLRPARGTLHYAGEPFDRITIESGETEQRAVQRAVVATAGDGAPTAWYEPGAGLLDGGGDPSRVPLHNVRYAITFGPPGVERALLAAFGTPTWLHGPGFSLEVGGRPDEAQFELHAVGAACSSLCEPALLRTVIPVAGAMAVPASAPLGSRIDLTGESAGARLCFDAARGCEGLFVAPAPPLSLLRPKDLLALEFDFVNLALDLKGAGNAELVRTPGNNPSGSYVVVRFPPQNIAEQAFFETAKDAANPGGYSNPYKYVAKTNSFVPTKKDDAGYTDPSTGSEKPEMPVDVRIAGRSRLAFRLPTGLDRIDYTLASLLDWARFEPSVTATALPPPPFYFLAGGFIAVGQAGAQPARKAGGAMRVSKKVKAAPQVDVSAQRGVAQRLLQAVPRRAGPSPQRLNAIAAVIAQTRPGGAALSDAAVGEITAHLLVAPYPPASYQTGIESPYRLVVSPNRFSAWAHATTDVTPLAKPEAPDRPLVTELWHTRLGVKRDAPKPDESPVDEDDSYYRTIRAVWSPDYNEKADADTPAHFKPPHNTGNLFRMSLDARDRHELVTLTADQRLEDAEQRIVSVDRLMLSALGAWMNVRGAWDLGPVAEEPLSVEEWRHRATMGRDHYVKVVYKGCLFPFGHRASLIKVTERKFHWVENHHIAYLRQRMYVVVRQPEKDYPAPFQPHEGRKFPFKRVRILTLVTPNLDEPSTNDIAGGGGGQNAFWMFVNGTPFPFNLVCEDVEGHAPHLTMPLAFIDVRKCHDQATAKAAAESLAAMDWKARPLHGQKVSFADPTKPGDTTLETESITFGGEFNRVPTGPNLTGAQQPEADDATLIASDQTRFYPTVEAARVEIPAVRHLTGAAGGVGIKIAQAYVDHAFNGVLGEAKNYGQLFAELDAPAGLGFGNGGVGTDKVGGFAAPSLNILGLSRLTGPVSGQVADGLTEMTKGNFDPKTFFKGLDVKLLGAVSLLEIVRAVTGVDGPGFAEDLNKAGDGLRAQLEEMLKDLPGSASAAKLMDLPKCRVPAFLTQLIYDDTAASDVDAALRQPKQAQIVFKWDPVVDSVGPFRRDGPANETLSLTSLALVQLPKLGETPKDPTYTVAARLQNFTLDLFGIIAIKVNSVKFTKQANQKPDVSADVETIEFAGPLRFVNELQSVIPSDGFSDPPSLEVTPTGLKLGYSLGLPTIAVGAFTLQNVTLGAALSLPFTGDPLRFRFFFCTREQPFLLTVYGLGGGGFFGIELGMDGVELLEAALEFGASVAIDLGVASGGVTIMGGVYFKIEQVGGDDVTTITGYVRLNGELDVLGLISASLTFNLSLTYQSDPEMVWGEATLTIEVEVAFFSEDVEVSVRKEFATPPAPPFAALMNPTDWNAYRKAFAA